MLCKDKERSSLIKDVQGVIFVDLNLIQEIIPPLMGRKLGLFSVQIHRLESFVESVVCISVGDVLLEQSALY